MRTRFNTSSPFEPQVGFSRAVRHGDRILVAGSAPLGPDGTTVPGDVAAQARRCFAIVKEAVEALGGRVDDVVRTRMYLVDPADGDAVGRAHGEAFGEVRPAATMVVVKALLDPAWRVEVEAEAELASPGR